MENKEWQFDFAKEMIKSWPDWKKELAVKVYKGIDGLESGLNRDWRLVGNTDINVLVATKSIDKTRLHISHGREEGSFELEIFFFHHNCEPAYSKLQSQDIESACNEADNIYQTWLTEEIKYWMNQLKALLKC